jgi:tetratricopeptide (TPR) repeat protein
MLTDEMKRPRIRYLLERGRAFNSAGDADTARPLFVEAWAIGRESGEDALAVDAGHMVAITESGEKALEWNERALDYANQSSDPKAKRWNTSLYNNIGWTYHDMGQYEIALDKFENALICCEELGIPSRIRIAKWAVGRVYRSLGRVEEALAIHAAQVKESEAIGEKPGYTYEELGECLLTLGRQDEARPYFQMAYTELSQDGWLMQNEAERLARLKTLGQ